MKRKLHVVFTVLIFSISTAFSQNLKLQGGISISNIQQQPVVINHAGNSLGLALNAGIEYLQKKHFGLSSGIGFLQKGYTTMLQEADYAGNPTGKTVKENYQLNALTFNTSAEASAIIGNNIVPFFHLGPTLNLIVSSNGRLNYKTYNTVTFGLITGAGIKYRLKKGAIGAQYNYIKTFGNIYESSTLSIKDNVQTVQLFYILPLHK